MIDRYSTEFIEEDWELKGITLQYTMLFSEKLDVSRIDFGRVEHLFIIHDWVLTSTRGEDFAGQSLDGLSLLMVSEDISGFFVWVSRPADISCKRFFVEIELNEAYIATGGDAECFLSGSREEDEHIFRSLVEGVLLLAKGQSKFSDAFAEPSVAEVQAAEKISLGRTRCPDNVPERTRQITREYLPVLYEMLP